MKQSKRVFAMILALIMVISMIPVSVFATEVPTFSISSVNGNPGDEVEVKVSISNNPGIMVMNYKIVYDTTRLERVEFTGYGMGGGVWTIGENTDKALWDGATDSTFNGDIMTLKFKIKENAPVGDAKISIKDFDIVNEADDEIIPNMVAGKVSVVAKPVTGISLDKSELSLDQGATATLTATVEPADAGNKKVNWTSSNEQVATVDNGVVTAVGAGTATITAKTEDGNFTATCAVTVTGANVPVTGITLGSAPSAIIAGDEITLTATVTPDYATDKTVTWTTSNEAVATVDANGVVTAVGAGSVTITAAAGEVSATKTFKVYDNLYEVTVDGEAANLTIGKYDNSNTWYRIDVPAGTKTIGISGVGDLRFVNHGNKNPKNGDCPAGMTYEDGVLYMDLDTYTRNDSYMAQHYGLTYDKYTQRSLEFWGSNNWKMTCFFVVIEPCEGAHTWVDANCTEPKHCSVCGTIEGEALGHDWVVTTPEVPAVCETPGTTAIESCNRDGCDATQGGNTIAAPGHKWWKVMVTKKPTCDEDGEELYTCLTCPEDNAATKTEPIAALGHTWDEGEVTTDPTCTEKGVKTFHCTVCEDGEKTEDVPANGHNYVDGYCSVCNKMEPILIPFTTANHTNTGSPLNSNFNGVEGLQIEGIKVSDWTEWGGGSSLNKSITIYVDPVYKNDPVTIRLLAKSGYAAESGLFASPVTVQLADGVGEHLSRTNKIQMDGLPQYVKANFGCFVYFKLGECTGEHTWAAATCTEPKTCSVCYKTEGEALGHSWDENSTCTVCGKSNKITDIQVSHPNMTTTGNTQALKMTTGTNEKITVSFNAVDNNVGATQVVAWFSDNEEVATVVDGVITAHKAGTAIITAKAVDTNGIALLADGEEVLVQFTLTVADPNPGYTVTMGDDVLNTVIGSTVSVPVTVGNTGDVTKYNAFDFTFTYDPTVLELTSTQIEGMTVTVKEGKIHVERYGTDLTVGGTALTLTFKAIATGSTNVKVTSAKVDISEAALTQDAPDASVIDNITMVSVAGYTVSLPAEFQGESSILPGESYTFEAKDKNYTYDVTAKIGETEIDVTDNGDGTFTIDAKDITGNIVITTEKSGKLVTVQLGVDMTGDAQAQYMTPYTATLNKADGYNYNVTVTINNVKFTGFTYDAATGLITIPGEAITGEIVFNSNKTAKTPDKHSVEFTGEYGDIAEGTLMEVDNGTNYILTINKVLGYKYTVTATMAGEPAEVIDNGDGTYTIENVTGDLVITIAKEYDLAVEVTEYVKLNGKVMFLVTATATVDEGKVLSYNGTAMFYSNQYNAWSYLVITEGTLSEDDAKALITLNEGEKVELDQTYNVNESVSGTVDINDAQLVFDMYNNKYQDFINNATMQKFLKADVNGDKTINTGDAAAVVSEIVKNK